MNRKFALLLISPLFTSVGCSSESTVQSNTPTTPNNDAPPAVESALSEDAKIGARIPAPCGDGGLALDDVVAVSGDHELRQAASPSSAKIRNEKASRALGRDHFHKIDNSTTVRRVCVQADWTEIRIETPDWLNQVRGWVPSNALREIQRTNRGSRVYTEDDFTWDQQTSNYRGKIVSVVNRIASENQNCATIDTSSLALSPSKSTSSRPVFFVTCGTGPAAFNVWFSPEDAESGTTFTAKAPIERGAAANACEAAAKDVALHPSTVEFSRVWDMAYMPHPSGRTRVVSSFTAKNSLGLELKYRIDCLFEGQLLVESTIAERAD